MAATVASTAVTAETSATSITITKPTSLAATEMLIAVIMEEDGGVPSTPAGWTLVHSQASVSSMSSRTFAFFAKVADSSDAAASNFTFATSSGTHVLSGVLLRLTGAAEDTSLSVGGGNIAFNNTSMPTLSISVTPQTTDSVVVAVLGAGALSAASTVANPVISGTNPSWTELNQQTDGNIIYATYYADQASAAEITSITGTITTRQSTTDDVMALISVGAATDASGGNTLLTTTGTLFTQSGVSDVSGGNTLLTTTTTTNAQDGTGENRQFQTNTSKNAASPSNLAKS
jgi:hypothetical protein